MALAENLIFFIIACLVLVLAGSFLVRSLSKIASFLKLSEFVVGFVVMAVATSLPELFVGIASALAAKPALSLGNVIGSNIADITLVGGVIALLGRRINVRSKLIRKDSLWMIAIAALPMALMFIGKSLSKLDGAILVAVFLLYAGNLIKRRQNIKRMSENKVKKWDVVLSPAIFLVSLVLLFFSAEYVVKYGSALALDMFLPPILIGLFFIAIGTSLPELVFETTAVLKHHPEMALGDLIGSVVANSTLVLGVTALIYPVSADFLLFLTSAVFMIVVAFVFMVFIHSGRKLEWKEGLALLLLYILFIIVELTIKGVIG